MSKEEALKEMTNSLMEEAETRANARKMRLIEEVNVEANRQAKRILTTTMQRIASEHSIENTISVLTLESDKIKGKIIGREGRNIKSIEANTGVEIIVDDTPETIIISSFDPVRREVARLALKG